MTLYYWAPEQPNADARLGHTTTAAPAPPRLPPITSMAARQGPEHVSPQSLPIRLMEDEQRRQESLHVVVPPHAPPPAAEMSSRGPSAYYEAPRYMPQSSPDHYAARDPSWPRGYDHAPRPRHDYEPTPLERRQEYFRSIEQRQALDRASQQAYSEEPRHASMSAASMAPPTPQTSNSGRPLAPAPHTWHRAASVPRGWTGADEAYRAGRAPPKQQQPMSSPPQQQPLTERRPRGQGEAPPVGPCELLILEQPVHARACGAGDKDRRAVDPPPILEARFEHISLPEEEKEAFLRSLALVVNCTIYDVTGTKEETFVTEENGNRRRMLGFNTVAAFVGYGLDGKLSCFFPFDDLSIRTSGVYRLRFDLVRLDRPDSTKAGRAYWKQSSVLSNPITVYPAKDFPGMAPSSELTRHLKSQGCEIALKLGKEVRAALKSKCLRAGSGDGSDEYGDDGGAAAARKRFRMQ